MKRYYDYFSYGIAIAQARANKCLSHMALSKLLGVPLIEVSSVERGAVPSDVFVRKAASKIKVCLDDYVEATDWDSYGDKPTAK